MPEEISCELRSIPLPVVGISIFPLELSVVIVPSTVLGNFNVRFAAGLLSGAVIETLCPPECTIFILLIP